jgi:hypothetical protein
MIAAEGLGLGRPRRRPTVAELAEAYAIEAAREAWIEHRRVYGARRLTAKVRDRGHVWNSLDGKTGMAMNGASRVSPTTYLDRGSAAASNSRKRAIWKRSPPPAGPGMPDPPRHADATVAQCLRAVIALARGGDGTLTAALARSSGSESGVTPPPPSAGMR